MHPISVTTAPSKVKKVANAAVAYHPHAGGAIGKKSCHAPDIVRTEALQAEIDVTAGPLKLKNSDDGKWLGEQRIVAVIGCGISSPVLDIDIRQESRKLTDSQFDSMVRALYDQGRIAIDVLENKYLQ
jgi:hypothetical protein